MPVSRGDVVLALFPFPAETKVSQKVDSVPDTFVST
jgi:hypothetical protein